MPSAVHFQVVVGSTVEKIAEPNQPVARDFTFEMPADYAGNSRTSAILHFMAHPSRDPGADFQVQFILNGRLIYRYGPSSADFVRAFQVVFGSSRLVPGTNTLTIKRIRGEATLGVSSVVVWYWQYIDTTAPARGKPKPKAAAKAGK
ncbi:MAG: hypothetical protein U1E56_01695 [Bauldia sp.]